MKAIVKRHPRVRCLAYAISLILPSTAVYAEEWTFLEAPEIYVSAGMGVEALSAPVGGNSTRVDFAGTTVAVIAAEPISGNDDATAPLHTAAIGLGKIATTGKLSVRLKAEIFSGKEHTVAASFDSLFFGATGQVAAALQNHGVLVSLWADVRPFDDLPMTLSLGGGVGAVQTEIAAVTAVFDFGSATSNSFAFMLGGQVAWDFDENWTLALTGRYVDYGLAEVDTQSLLAQANPGLLVQSAPGRIAVDQNAFQALLSVRLRFGLEGI